MKLLTLLYVAKRNEVCLQFIRRLQTDAKDLATKNHNELSQRALTKRIQNEMFDDEKTRLLQINAPRIEKIKVNYSGNHLSDNVQMSMNKNLSTPHDCARHISHKRKDDSVIALVMPAGKEKNNTQQFDADSDSKSNGIMWDMHRPLETDCELKLFKFDMQLGQKWMHEEVNKAYWRSCAMVLGAVAKEAFDDNIHVSCAHLPEVAVENGAFCYDIELDNCLSEWKVDENVLITLTKTARKLISDNHKFERIEVKQGFAEDMFQNDENMLSRISNTNFPSASRNKRIILYRFGSYIDVMDGPLIANTSMMYQYVISAVHRLQSKHDGKLLWRFQGLSLPKPLQVHHAVWSTLELRSRKLVKENLPFEIEALESHNTKFAKHTYKSLEGKTKKYNINTGQWLENGWLSDAAKIKL